MQIGICIHMCNCAEIGDGKYPSISIFQNKKPERIKHIIL